MPRCVTCGKECYSDYWEVRMYPEPQVSFLPSWRFCGFGDLRYWFVRHVASISKNYGDGRFVVRYPDGKWIDFEDLEELLGWLEKEKE